MAGREAIENEIKSCLTMPTPRVLGPEYDEPLFVPEPLGLFSGYALLMDEYNLLTKTLLVVIIQRQNLRGRDN